MTDATARRRSAVQAAIVVVVGVVLSGCTVSADLGSSDPTPTPPASRAGTSVSPSASTPGDPTSTKSVPANQPPPSREACYRLTSRDLSRFANHDKSVPCRTAHTSVTFFIGKLPAHVVTGTPPVTDPAVQKAAPRVCAPAFRRYVGGDWQDRLLARFNFTYYLPDAVSVGPDTNWVRCDLYLTRTVEGGKTYPHRLPHDARGALDKSDALDLFGICSPSAPGTAGFKLLLCSHRHDWRSIAPIRLGSDNTVWPGVKEVKDRGDSRCSDAVRQWLGYPTTWRYGWQWPTRSDWTNGQRFGYCWAQYSG
jgi:Septum formation